MKTHASLLAALIAVPAPDLVSAFSHLSGTQRTATTGSRLSHPLQQRYNYPYSLSRVFAATLPSKTGEESPREVSSSASNKNEDSEADDISDAAALDSIEKDDTNSIATAKKIESTVTRLRRLKDLVWVREALEDLTAAEFACSVEAHEAEGETDETVQKKRKRAVVVLL